MRCTTPRKPEEIAFSFNPCEKISRISKILFSIPPNEKEGHCFLAVSFFFVFLRVIFLAMILRKPLSLHNAYRIRFGWIKRDCRKNCGSFAYKLWGNIHFIQQFDLILIFEWEPTDIEGSIYQYSTFEMPECCLGSIRNTPFYAEKKYFSNGDDPVVYTDDGKTKDLFWTQPSRFSPSLRIDQRF